MQKQQGFTLIELVVVIVILGILAATALPKFVDLSTEANAAALEGVAGAIGSANAINYGARKVTATKGTSVSNCTDATKVLEGGMPTGYAASGGAVAVDTTVSCTLTQNSTAQTKTFPLTGIN